MPSISVPSEARLFDGASARARRVCVEREGDALLIDGDALPVALLRRVESRGRTTLHRTDQLDWRLVLAADDAIDLAGIPALHAVTATHWGWIGGAAAAVVFVAGTLWFAGPQLLVAAAPLVPHQVARGLGEPMAEMMAGEDKACRNPAGQRALTKLVARMQPREGFVEPVRVRVSRSGQINAFTLPGGDVILMSGLIAAAESPDEVAGVLAHEFGHVQQRHPNQALIRHFGLGVFIEGLGGA